jgi:uncharacterized protein
VLQYRTLGRTGLKVSQLGFGAMRLPMTGLGKDATVDLDKAVPLMQHAFEAGINYIDSAVFYCNHDSQRAVGCALKGWRDRVIVSTKNDYKGLDEAAWHKNLEDSLRFLQVDYIDLYNIHGISWKVYEEAVHPAIGGWLLRARDRGLIRHIGASCHDKPENMIRLIDTGFFEVFTVQYNLLDRAYEAAIAHAASKNVGIAVMGPLAGARVIASAEVFGTVLPHLSHVPELALRFVLANPNVSLALSGMESAEIIDQNARVAGAPTPLSPDDYAAIDTHLKKLRAAADLCCTNCGYCMPCPRNVRIPRIFNLYNLARIYKNWDGARRGYAGIKRDVWDPEAKQADACNECGECEKKCPQSIQIRKQLKDAHQALDHTA